MRVVLWTEQARADLAAIRAFIGQDSPHYASVIVSHLIAATNRLVPFPESGRAVQEFEDPLVREVVHPIRYTLCAGNRPSLSGHVRWMSARADLHDRAAPMICYCYSLARP